MTVFRLFHFPYNVLQELGLKYFEFYAKENFSLYIIYVYQIRVSANRTCHMD